MTPPPLYRIYREHARLWSVYLGGTRMAIFTTWNEAVAYTKDGKR